MLPIILRTFATIIKLFIARCLYFGLKCTRMRLLAGLVYTCCSGFRVEWNLQKMQRREKGVLCPLLNINTLWFWTKKQTHLMACSPGQPRSPGDAIHVRQPRSSGDAIHVRQSRSSGDEIHVRQSRSSGDAIHVRQPGSSDDEIHVRQPGSPGDAIHVWQPRSHSSDRVWLSV